ncbi:hypothetical protein AAMO2058_000697200 [Amorphochlora amoebiformis]
MAAVLCRALCVEPCEHCGEACDVLCTAFGKCCNGLCECVANGCAGICHLLGNLCVACGHCCDATVTLINDVFSEPMSGCLFFTVLLNLSPLAVAIAFLSLDTERDCPSVSTFIIISLVLFTIHMAYGTYMFFHLKKLRYEPGNESQPEHQRIRHFLKENYVTAVYIIIFLFAIAWAITGLVFGSRCMSDSDVSSQSKTLAAVAESIAVVSLVFYAIALCLFIVNIVDVEDCLKDCDPISCILLLACICLPCFWCCSYPLYVQRRRYNRENNNGRSRRDDHNPPANRVDRTARDPLRADNVIHPVAVVVSPSPGTAVVPHPSAPSQTAPAVGYGEPSWNCGKCTLVNPPYAAACQVCGHGRYADLRSPAPAQAQNPPIAVARPEEKKEEGGVMGMLNAGLAFIRENMPGDSKNNNSDARR